MIGMIVVIEVVIEEGMVVVEVIMGDNVVIEIGRGHLIIIIREREFEMEGIGMDYLLRLLFHAHAAELEENQVEVVPVVSEKIEKGTVVQV